MVRKKEPSEGKAPLPASKKIEVTRTSKPQPVGEYEDVPRARRSRKKGGGRIIVALLVVLVLLGLGWFAAQAILGHGNGGLFSGLLGGAKLAGEEDGRVNFLIMGNPGDPNYDGTELTDTVMVASYDMTNKTVNLFSLPRDLYVSVPKYGSTKVNAVYEIGKRQFDDGPGTLTKTIEGLLGIEIPYYFRIDFAGFEKIVDELGGVTLTVKKDLSDPFYPAANDAYQTVEFKAGTYTMDGDMALKYARSRQTTSDFDRARRQQDVMIALRNKALDLELLSAPAKGLEIVSVLDKHFETNLSKEEFERFFKLMTELDSSKITNKVFDDSPDGLLYATRVGEAYALKPLNDDYSKLAEYVESVFAGGSAPVEEQPAQQEEPLTIEVLNGTNITGLAGKVADKLADAKYTVSRTANNPTKGVEKTVVYDNTNGQKLSAINKLAQMMGATVSTEKLTMPAGVEARVVVGRDAEEFVK